jgi:hypothetical protein
MCLEIRRKYAEHFSLISPLNLNLLLLTILCPKGTPTVDGDQVWLNANGIWSPLAAPANHFGTMVIDVQLARLQVKIVDTFFDGKIKSKMIDGGKNFNCFRVNLKNTKSHRGQ